MQPNTQTFSETAHAQMRALRDAHRKQSETQADPGFDARDARVMRKHGQPAEDGRCDPTGHPERQTRFQALLRGHNALSGLPAPGSGATWARWQVLARVAAADLCAVKLFEGHTDALAILAELGVALPCSGSTWGVWAAEPPGARVLATRVVAGETSGGGGAAQVRLSGRKSWCSGAGTLSHALMTCALEGDDPSTQWLVAVPLDAPGVRITGEGWHAVGMAQTASVDVVFDDACGWLIGEGNAYLHRPGFWQGGAGIAACWFGGALPLAAAVMARQRARPDSITAMHLGAIDVALRAARALLMEAARSIDHAPLADAALTALRVRGAVESAVETVLLHAGHALGAGPMCRDAALARRFADLPVFLRQSHAERDLAEIGARLGAVPPDAADPAASGLHPWLA